MFAIHVFNVKLGDSIILETKLEKSFAYSIVDCKKVGNKTPIVEFLKKRKIKNIHSLFLTHFHRDHCSGLPQLLNYLLEVDGTLEHYVSPCLPEELGLRERLLRVLYEEPTKEERKNILKAINGLQKIPSKTHENKKVLSIRMNFEGDKTERSWRSHLHPGLSFSFLHPNPQEALQFLSSTLEKAETQGKFINSLSHSFLIQCSHSTNKAISFFTGDLEGPAWRAVKNRCLERTNSSIRSKLVFFKVPHHGGFNPIMEKCLVEIIAADNLFVASISNPPGDYSHPSKTLLEFLKKEFRYCCIACTNISGYCNEKKFPSKGLPFFEQSAKEADFLDFVFADQHTTTPSDSIGSCAGHHTFTLSDEDFKLTRSSGISCGFHQEN